MRIYRNADLYDELPKLRDKSISGILSDLPFGVTRSHFDKVINPDFLWHHMLRVIESPNSPMILHCQFPYTKTLLDSKPKDVKYYDLVVWDKQLVSGHLNAKTQPLRSHEHLIVFYQKQLDYKPIMTEGQPLHGKGVAYLNREATNRNYGKFEQLEDNRKGSTLKYPKSVISIQKVHPSKALHATEKPVILAEYLYKTYFPKKGTILDMCAGVGWTAIGAHNLGLNFFCCELDPTNYSNGVKKLKDNNVNFES